MKKKFVLLSNLPLILSFFILTGFAKDNSGEKMSADTIANNAPDKQILVIDHDVTSHNANITYSEIILSDELKEKYPKLAKAIADKNTAISNEQTDFLKEYSFCDDEFPSASDRYSFINETAKIQRADDSIFSITYNYQADVALAAHPNSSTYGYNIDTASGTVLDINQIVTDSSALTTEFAKKLLDKEHSHTLDYLIDSFYIPWHRGDYLDSPLLTKDEESSVAYDIINDEFYSIASKLYSFEYLSDYDSTMANKNPSKPTITFWINYLNNVYSDSDCSFDEYVYQKCDSFLFHNEYLNFTLDEKGLNIHMNDYDIAPYAYHVIDDFHFPYSEYPELFNKKYYPDTNAQNINERVEYKTSTENLDVD